MNTAAIKLSVLAISLISALSCSSAISQSQTLSSEQADGRLRMALQIAREKNDRNLVSAIEELGRAFGRKLPEDAEAKLRELEKKVGIDPGGWSMAGQPLFHPTHEMLQKSAVLGPKLAAAMKSDEAAQVRAVTAEMLSVLGDQAGVPDGRRAGIKPDTRPINEADSTKLFLDALASEGRTIRSLTAGRLLPDQMVRVYAYVLNATCTIRPFAAKHQSDSLPELDKLTASVAGILTTLQQPDGIFPFPDLRGKNIRFGDMIQKQVNANQVEVRDGWIVSADPDGGSQFDTGLCGAALLLAGQLHDNADWKRAGLRAADWSLAQPCCSNFNYNAFSVSLLAHAFRISGETKYLEGALQKFRVGMAPGQARNGRWIDSHNARTVYHVIILRALGDLASVLTANLKSERAELDQIARPAIEALLDEFDAMGITVEALPELLTLASLYPSDRRLQKAADDMAAVIVAKCTDGRQVKMGAQPNQLAAVAPACSVLTKAATQNK